MRIGPSVCQQVDFRLPKFLPTAENKHEYGGVRELHFASRRRITKIKATATMIAAGMSPLRA
jgi:hypothetical protein